MIADAPPTPFLSVVVSAFNRAGTIGRCLLSVLAQSEPDWELVCVDDGSTDRTVEAVHALADRRIRLVRHDANRGVGPARNTGIDAARGEWLVFLDSDDELAGPHALGRMADAARAAPSDLHALWFRCRLDNGTVSPPDPLPVRDDWDYEGYLRFTEATHGLPRDMIRCVRRRCFEAVRYPDGRMLEEGFHLDFARRFRSRVHPDILRLYHQDAPNQLVTFLGSRRGRADQPLAQARADGLRALVRDHGAALARHAPRSLRAWGFRGIRLALRAGDGAGARATAGALADAMPTDAAVLAVSVAAVLGSRLGRRAGLALVLPLGFLLAGCGTVDTAAMPLAPAVPTLADVAPVRPPYRIQPGDVLDIRLATAPELDDEVTVRPDGGLSTTVVPDTEAAGLTVPELERRLARRYAATMRDPALTVVVRTATPFHVFVAGEVAHPGEVRGDPGDALTLVEALTLAGGPRLSGDRHRVFILRHGADGRARVFRTRYDEVAEGAAPGDDVRLASGDVVFVPRTGITLVYETFNQYLQQFVPVSWGFSYVLNNNVAVPGH